MEELSVSFGASNIKWAYSQLKWCLCTHRNNFCQFSPHFLPHIKIRFNSGLGTEHDPRKPLHIDEPGLVSSLRHHRLSKQPVGRELCMGCREHRRLRVQQAGSGFPWKNLILALEAAYGVIRDGICPFPLTALCRIPSFWPKFWTVQINPESTGFRFSAASCPAKGRNPTGLLCLCSSVSQLILFVSCPAPLPSPSRIQQVFPWQHHVKRSFPLTWEKWWMAEKNWLGKNLGIQLKIGKAIMEGDSGRLPGDSEPFWRARYRLNAICCFSLMRRQIFVFL